jgi:hypothetical protein
MMPFYYFLIVSFQFFIQGENMKLVSLLAILILSVSCGKDGGGSAGSSSKSGACELNGRAVQCEQINGADGLGVDLLETMIDAPVVIEGSEIKFMADKTATSQGRRISCQTSVKNGEIYRFALRGSGLLVMTASGSYEMEKLSDGVGLLGTYKWNGYVDQGTHVIRQMSFLSNSRVILRTSCEL